MCTILQQPVWWVWRGVARSIWMWPFEITSNTAHTQSLSGPLKSQHSSTGRSVQNRLCWIKRCTAFCRTDIFLPVLPVLPCAAAGRLLVALQLGHGRGRHRCCSKSVVEAELTCWSVTHVPRSHYCHDVARLFLKTTKIYILYYHVLVRGKRLYVWPAHAKKALVSLVKCKKMPTWIYLRLPPNLPGILPDDSQ